MYILLTNNYTAFESYEEYVEWHNKHVRTAKKPVEPLNKFVFEAKCRRVLGDVKEGKLVVANPAQVGQPKEHIISGQDFYSGVNDFIRGKCMAAIKEQFLPYVKDLPRITTRPIQFNMVIHDTVMSEFDRTKDKDKAGIAWDIRNRGYPYIKAMPDLLQELGKLSNDDRLHITSEQILFHPIEDVEQRKLVFQIIKDERKIFKTHKLYS